MIPNQVKGVWKCCEDWVHQHERATKHIAHGAHLTYFALIVFHGPYHVAAGGLLVIGAVSWIFHVE